VQSHGFVCWGGSNCANWISFECTQYVRSSDGGQECVGDYERVQGPDKGATLILTVAGVFAFWFGIKAPEGSR
jgi:hypothetical protein